MYQDALRAILDERVLGHLNITCRELGSSYQTSTKTSRQGPIHHKMTIFLKQLHPARMSSTFFSSSPCFKTKRCVARRTLVPCSLRCIFHLRPGSSAYSSINGSSGRSDTARV